MSQEGNQLKFDLVKKLFSEYNPEIVNFLKEKDYKYEILQIQDFSLYQSEKETEEEISLAYIEPVLFHKLNKIADFIGDDVNNFIEALLNHIIEGFEEDTYNDLSYWLSEEDLLDNIFNK